MSALIQIQQMEELERLISDSPIVLVEFGSRQCAPCHALRHSPGQATSVRRRL